MMKKVLAVLVSLVLFGSFAVAQAADEKKDAMPMMEHQMMMHDMMQLMKDMMAIEKKMLITSTPEDKAQMGKDLSAMMEKMDKMMSSAKCMMMDMLQPVTGEQKKQDSMPTDHMN